MGKYGPVIIVSAGIMALIAILGFAFFEIAPVKKPVQPSWEFFENEFFALERWLSETGHPARTWTGTAALADRTVTEKIIYIQGSFFSWAPEDCEFLKTWVKEGGRLLVSLDNQWDRTYPEGMEQFLSGLGIQSAAFLGGTDPEAGAEQKSEPAEAAPEKGGEEQPISAEIDYTIRFNPSALPPRTVHLKDQQGNSRVITIKLGEGAVSFFGEPIFMRNNRLEKSVNARLAWRLTGAEDREGRGVFFIRGEKALPGLAGKLKAEGDLFPPLISFVIVLIAGFWMIVPVFGRLTEPPERPGKPIGERFLAEARFLKRYGSLDAYLEPYRETIRQSRADVLTGMPGGFPPWTPDEDPDLTAAYCHKLAELCRMGDDEVMALFKKRPPGSLRSGEFVRIMETVHAILERL